MRLGALHYLVKPFTFAALRTRLESYAALRRTVDRVSDQGVAGQEQVDRMFGALRTTPAPSSPGPPTGHSEPTTDLICTVLHQADHPSRPTRSPPKRASAAPPPSATSATWNRRAVSGSHSSTGTQGVRNTAMRGSRLERVSPAGPPYGPHSPCMPHKALQGLTGRVSHRTAVTLPFRPLPPP